MNRKVSYGINSPIKERSWFLTFASEKDFAYYLSYFLNKMPGVPSTEEINQWVEKNPIIKSFVNQDIFFLEKDDNDDIFLSVPLGDAKRARLYTKQIRKSDDFEIKESYFLSGLGPIPNLWYYVTLYVSSFKTDNSLSQLNKNLSHNEFLVKSLSELFNLDIDDSFLNDVSSFYSSNEDQINKLRYHFKTQPQKLGKGADGVVWSISPHQILKIFKDRGSYNAAKAAIQRLHNNPELAKTEAMIYDVGVLGTFKSSSYSQPFEVYYYIMEKMTPIRSILNVNNAKNAHGLDSLKRIMSNIGKLLWRDRLKLDPLKEIIRDPSKDKAVKKSVTEWSKNISQLLEDDFQENISFIENIVKLNNNWLLHLVEEIVMKYLTGRTDLHLGNLGVTNYGEFRYFDPIHSGGDSGKLNLPEYDESSGESVNIA